MNKSILLLMLLSATCTAKADVVWFDGTNPVSYQVVGKTDVVVRMALEMFSDDMEQVTGRRPVASRNASIRIVQGKGLDDGFRLSVSDGQVVIEGHNARGTAYGLLELSRMAGVSPWVWWGDVRPQKRNDPLSLPDTFCLEHTPSVVYRGIFINDEDWSLRRWSSDHMGPQTYKRLFQLMLRLRANTLWPAMHEGTPGFFTVKGNQAMADSFGIVVGTSHCEPLLRNNVAEWDQTVRGPYNYMTNRQQVQQYWTERLKEVRGTEALFTLGMRGIHDGSMEGVSTREEKLQGLQQVVDDQRRLLRKYYHQNVEQVPQVFIPYKEVLEIMESGLQVPDDVTLMWCDDNYGYLTRLPDAQQQQRKGGGGVYYHLSYWGRPHDYLWLTTTQPGLIYSEMRAAYDHNCRRLWIANVHDPKVAAYDLELFMDMAWNIESITPSQPPRGEAFVSPTGDERGVTIEQHLKAWLCRQFGKEAGERLFPAMHEFYRLCGIRRPEFMGWTQVELDKKKFPRGLSPVAEVPLTAQEAAVRLAVFERIKLTAQECRSLVRRELQDAFFAAIEYPVSAAAAMNRKILSDSTESHQAYEEIQSLTRQYNELRGGKWRGLMDAAPRKLPVYEDVHGRLTGIRTNTVDTINACDYVDASGGVRTIQMLGHSMKAISLQKGGIATYRFHVEEAGNYIIRTALIPTHPNDDGDLRFSVSVDTQEPITYSLKEPFRSERWKLNVLNGQAVRDTKAYLSKGNHMLTIRALDDHIVIDQIFIK